MCRSAVTVDVAQVSVILQTGREFLEIIQMNELHAVVFWLLNVPAI